MTETEQSFCRAVSSGDAAGLRRLLAGEPDPADLVNRPLLPFDSPALVVVARRGEVDVLEVLLEFGADPDLRTAWWAGPFHALHGATPAAAERLLAAGATPDACAAAHLDRLELLRAMLDEDPSRVHERGGDGQTPLHFARSRAVVDILLARGADIDARDIDHRSTAAEWMLEGRRGAGRYDLAAYLVERGASCDAFLAAALGLVDRLHALLAEDPSVVDLRTGRGTYGEKGRSSFHIYTWTIGPSLSPLQVAAQFEQPEAFELLARRAGPRARFVAASAAAMADEARRLLAERPGLPGELTLEDHSALAHAAWRSEGSAVELMVELGFDPAAPGQDGGSALHCAAWMGCVRCVKAILASERGRALLSVRDPSHEGTPLDWCCHGASQPEREPAPFAQIARLLLQAGARPVPLYDRVPTVVRRVVEAFASDQPET